MKAKKIFLFLLAVQLILCLSFPVAASEYDVSFAMEGQPSIAVSGEALEITISVTENKGFLLAVGGVLTFDSNVLEYAGCSDEGSEFAGVTVSNVLASGNQIKINIGNPMNKDVYTQTGKVVVLKFNVAENYEGTVDFSLVFNTKNISTSEGKYGVYNVNSAALSVNVVDKATHNHDNYEAIILPGVAADCLNTGLTEGKQCSFCGEITLAQEVVPAAGHTEEIIAGKAATCTETGLTEGKKCSVCAVTLVEQTVVPAKGHTEEVVPAVDATCVATGLTEGKKCSVCATVLVEQTVVPAKGHTEEVVPAVDATCAATGLTEGKKCSVCNEILVAQNEVAALGHTYDNACDVDCNVCKEERTPADHVYGDWTTTKEATKKEEGSEERTCSVCGNKDVRAIEMIKGMPAIAIVAIVVVCLAAVGVGGFFVYKKIKK